MSLRDAVERIVNLKGKKLLCLQFLLLFTLLFGAYFAPDVYAFQVVSPSAQDERAGEKQFLNEYRATVGEALSRNLFRDNCSGMFGKMASVSGKTFDFRPEDALWGSLPAGTITGIFYLNPFIRGESPWYRVKVKESASLFVVRCLNYGGEFYNRQYVSDERLYPSIRSAVAYHYQLKDKPQLIEDSPKMLRRRNDPVLAGYVTGYLKGSGLADKNKQALLQSRFISEPQSPPGVGFWAMVDLRRLLSGEFTEPLHPKIRASVLKRIIKSAAEMWETTNYSLRLLIELSAKETFDIKPYLDKNTRRRLLRNYQKLNQKDYAEEKRRNFEKQLADD